MFSPTTIASSTTIPIARINPNKVNWLMVTSAGAIRVKAPTNDTPTPNATRAADGLGFPFDSFTATLTLLLPIVSVERPEINCLTEMSGLNLFALSQIGNGAADSKDFVVGACRKAHFFHGSAQQFLGVPL